MLTARRAFAGEDVADTLAFVLSREPDWSALPATTPGPIRKLLSRCLEKDRRRRLADIADARLDLDEASSPPKGRSRRNPDPMRICRRLGVSDVSGSRGRPAWQSSPWSPHSRSP